MSEILQISEDGKTAVLSNAVVTTKPKTPVISQNASGMGDVASYGDSNNFPNEVVDYVEKTPVLSSALYWLSNALISGGLVYGSLKIDEDTGEDKLMRKQIADIEQFLSRNSVMTDYLPVVARQYLTFFNAFFQFIVSDDRSKITTVSPFLTPHCRISKQDPKALRSLNLYVNANSTYGFSATATETLKLPLIDPSYMPVESLRLRNEKHFGYHVKGPSLRENYYARAPWHAIINSKWLELANQIPEFKTAIMKNQMTLKYHVEIDEGMWSRKFMEKWESFSADEKMAKIKDEYKAINTYLTNVENSGKGLFSNKWHDENGNEISGVKITRKDDSVQNGAYVEDSQEANSHILYALGFSGTLIGQTPAKSLGSGSGSDKREDWNILITKSKPEQDMILKPLQFVAQYNNWTDKNENPIVFWFKNYYLQTLDQVNAKQRTGQQPAN